MMVEGDARAPSPGSSRASSIRHSGLAAPRLQAGNDVFIILKYPPSSSNHPYNAQVALVNQRNTANYRTSGEWSRNGSQSSLASSGISPIATAKLERTPSVRSARSYSSSASHSTGQGSTRKTTPLYNLEFHKFRETLVLDAGTEAKIARFMKKGIELLDFVVVDPMDSKVALRRPLASKPAEEPKPTQESPKQTTFLNKLRRISLKAPFKPPQNAASTLAATKDDPNVLGLFQSRDPDAGSPPRDRDDSDEWTPPRVTTAYTWVVRKWLRKDLEGQETDPALQGVQLHWKRHPRRVARPMERSESGTSGQSQRKGSFRAGNPTPVNSPGTAKGPQEILTRGARSLDLVRSRSSTTSLGDDDGDLSDPEDSDRPWICTLVLPPLPGSITGEERRIWLGTLTPAPHHPKLVGHVSVPFYLSAVELKQDMLLSSEEMKDLLFITGLWLTVREGLGGIANRRKGDGLLRIGV